MLAKAGIGFIKNRRAKIFGCEFVLGDDRICYFNAAYHFISKALLSSLKPRGTRPCQISGPLLFLHLSRKIQSSGFIRFFPGFRYWPGRNPKKTRRVTKIP